MMEQFPPITITYISQASIFGSGASGGARVKNMVNLFNKMNCRIRLVSYSFYSEKFEIERENVDKLEIININMPKKWPRILKAMTIIPAFAYSCKYARTSDIIFSDFISILSSIPAVCIGKIYKKPIILDYIDKKLIDAIPNIFYKYIARNTNLMLAISPYLMDSAKNEYLCKKAIYIPNSIDTDHFKIDYTYRKKIRMSLGAKDNETIIGYAGSLIYWEGVPILVNAFRDLIQNYPNIRLAIMGDLTYTQGLRDNIPKLVDELCLNRYVYLISSKKYEDVPKYLSAFDILCCPKIDCEVNRAASPVKVTEYLSMGIPTICSSVGGINELIVDGETGFLVAPGDLESLKNKIEWVLQNRDEAKMIANNGRGNAMDRFTYEKIGINLMQEISKIIS